jgi:hypothetical protein
MDIDVVVPGGGLGALYTLAGVALIRELEDAGTVRVHAYYATSAGGILAATALCFDADEMVRRTLEFVVILQERARTHWAHEAVTLFVEAMLPADAHVRCTGRLVLSTTRGTRRETVCAYGTRDELVRALVDSCRLPLLTAPLRCVFGRHDGYLPPTPPLTTRNVVTLPYPPAWRTLKISIHIVWWASQFLPVANLRARARAALVEGLDLAAPRISRVIDVPLGTLTRTRAILAQEHTKRKASSGGLMLAVRAFAHKLVRRILRQVLRSASNLTRLELRNMMGARSRCAPT